MAMDEPFWNLTSGRRPVEPVLGLFADICESSGHHVYDTVYGPDECARCGFKTLKPWRTRLLDRLRDWLCW